MLGGSIEGMRRLSKRSLRKRVVFVALLLVATVAFLGARAVKSLERPVVSPKTASAGSYDGVAPPTVEQPLPAALAKETTLRDAPSALGGPVVLPNTATVDPSEAGAVWMASLDDQETGTSTTTVAVTFPRQGIVIEYTRPAPSTGTAAHFQAMAQGMVAPTGAQIGGVITLNSGVPALAVQQNSDETTANFGEVIFNVDGTEVRVMGHNDQATLQGIAQSILTQSGS